MRELAELIVEQFAVGEVTNEVEFIRDSDATEYDKIPTSPDDLSLGRTVQVPAGTRGLRMGKLFMNLIIVKVEERYVIVQSADLRGIV